MGVAVVPCVPNINSDPTLERYTQDLGNAWGVGEAGCDNGAMIVLSQYDQKFYIETNYGKDTGLQQAVPSIVSSASNYFKQGEFGAGIAYMVDSLGACALSLYEEQCPYSGGGGNSGGGGDSGGGWWWIVFAVAVPLLFFAACVSRRRRRFHVQHQGNQYRRARSALTAMQADRDQIRTQRERPEEVYESTTCPICFDPFRAAPGTPGKIPAFLPCGHKFCLTCLTDYFDNEQPLVNGQVPHQGPPPAGSGAGAGHAAGCKGCPICRKPADTSSIYVHGVAGVDPALPSAPPPPPGIEMAMPTDSKPAPPGYPTGVASTQTPAQYAAPGYGAPPPPSQFGFPSTGYFYGGVPNYAYGPRPTVAHYESEWGWRLGRMNYLWPTLITASMLSSWYSVSTVQCGRAGGPSED